MGGNLTFYIRPSTLAASNPKAFYGIQWGLQSDIAATYAADYDGDGRDDLTVIRRDSSSLEWFILRSNTNTFSAVSFGSAESDRPVIGADYNGDGRAEITVIRKYFDQPGRTNTYFAGDSNTGALVLAQDWGGGDTSDFYVIGDYLGDRRADFAVMRKSYSGGTALNATWYILENGGSGQIVVRQFGYGYAGPENDSPICGDYNGDGKQDIAVYREANRTFYWLNSPDFNNFSYQQWGATSGGNLAVGALHAFIR